MINQPKSFIEELDEFLENERKVEDAARKPRRKQTPHKKAVKEICKALFKLDPKPMVTVRNVGIAKYKDRKGDIRQFTYGRSGEGDIDMTWMGQRFSIEVKVGRDFQRTSQEKFQNKFEAAGGVYFIASSAAQAIAYLKSWRDQKEFGSVPFVSDQRL